MTIYLVTLDRAKTHLRPTDAETDAELMDRIADASAIVLKHCNTIPAPEETSPDTSIVQMFGSDTVPYDIQAATLLVLGEIHEKREAVAAEPLSRAVLDLLRQYRDPVLA